MRTLRSTLALALSLTVACGGARPRPPTTATTDPPTTTEPTTVPPPTEPARPAEPPLPLWPQVRRGTLANGLTYYVMPHGKPEHRAALWLAVNAGALQEDDDQRGLAHFVEHMAFNGTARFGKQAIVDYLEKIGMKFGPDVNAYTSFDQTVYMIQVPTDDPTHLATGLDILRDWAGGISFDAAEVEKERGVVLEEWRLGKGPWRRIFDKQAPVVFGGTRYAQRLPIGLPEIIKGAPKDALARFYRDWYRPELMAVIVVGEVEPDATIAAITARFGDLTNPAKPRERTGGGALDRSGTKIAIDTDPELPSASVSVQNLFPRRSELTEADLRAGTVDDLYHTMLGARLRELGRNPEAPFAFAFSGTGSETRDHDVFSRTAMAKDGRLEDCLRVLLTEVLRVERHGFTTGELERARKSLLRNREQSAAEWEHDDAGDYADEITRNFFEGEYMIGREAERDYAARYLPTITLDELNAAARGWGGAETRAVLISAPADAAGVPTKARVQAILTEVETLPLEPWVDRPPPARIMASAPTPGAVVSERVLADLGLTEWTLANGAKVVLKPTTFESQTVHLQATSIGGSAQVADKDFVQARSAIGAVMAGGVGALSAGDLERALSGHTVFVQPWLGEQNEGLFGRAAADDLELMLQLVHLRLTAPRKDPAAFEAWRAAQIAGVERRTAVPETVFSDEVRALASGGHLRRKPPTAADLRALDLDRALAIYRQRLGDAGDFVFVLVGNLEPAQVKPLVETYLGGLPGTRRVEKRKDLRIKEPRGKVEKTWNLGSEPKSRVELTFHADDRWSKDAARDVAILGEVLGIRLREILREDMGGVYGVGAFGFVSRGPDQRRTFSIRFGCAPENVEALRAAVFTEVARLQKDGVDASYLDKVKELRRRAFETQSQRNDWWLSQLTSAYDWGDDPHDLLDLDPTLARVTAANVKAAARRFLADKQYVLAIMKPATSAQPSAPAAP